MQNHQRVMIVLIICCVQGCGHSESPAPGVHVLPVTLRAAMPATPEAARLRIDPAAAAEVQVRVDPLYHQAELACKRKHYAYAAELLTKLSHEPGLNADQIAFCDSQINVCRKDAGLPPINAQHHTPPHLTSPARGEEQLRLSLGAAQTPSQANSAKVTPSSADCGPRALLIICNKLGVKADLTVLRKSANTTAEGTTLEGLATAAKSLGLQAEGVQTGRDALPGLQLPAIAWFNGNHFVALLAASGKGDDGAVSIHDPNKDREETMSAEAFLLNSAGYLLVVHKK